MILLHEREKQKQSDFSPTIISNDENLLRLIYNPEHFANGQLTNAAISSNDLIVGVSVDRKQFSKPDNFNTIAKMQMEKLPLTRQESYIAVLMTAEVRCLMLDTQRAFIVIDDGLIGNASHALILSNINEASKLTQKKLKGLIFPLILNSLSKFTF